VESSNIEQQLQQFESQQREQLGLNQVPIHWHDAALQVEPFDKSRHTVLFGSLTYAHDQLLLATLKGCGYRVEALPTPDVNSLQRGKEFGNRGQCNPTYFTVGNLVHYLQTLCEQQGLTAEQVVRDYAFVTASTCGPCRFGMYATEYRKALRDAGFEGFRVMSFQTEEAVNNEPLAFPISKRLTLALLRAVVIGDVINALGYRMRPYEVNEGETDQAQAQSMDLITAAIAQGKGLGKALARSKVLFNRIELNLLQAKPKVSIIGEFWAMTTEGEGNYQLQRFLESEGAECEVQPIAAWFLYLIWAERDSHAEATRAGQHSAWVGRLQQVKLRLVERMLKGYFQHISKKLGLDYYKLSDMDQLAETSKEYYPIQLRGGEGHMEVGKLIQSFRDKKHHLVLSVKPFGCMPSSGVSDGIQPLVTAHYPEANFLAVETSGDGAVNVYSRVQMALFRARKSAEAEYQAQLQQYEVDEGQLKQNRIQARYFPHHVAGTAANAVAFLSAQK